MAVVVVIVAASGVRGAARVRLAGRSLTAATTNRSRFSWDRNVRAGEEEEEEEEEEGLCQGEFFEAADPPTPPAGPSENTQEAEHAARA